MMRYFFSIILLVCVAWASADTAISDSINRQLDSPQKLDVNAVLPKAMTQITSQTSVPIVADPLVWELLPWGQETAIKARFEHRTLREALNAITQRLGLEWTVGDDAIHLQPMPALRRLGRRCTIEELTKLGSLNTTPLNLANPQPTVHELLATVSAQVAKGRITIQNRAADQAQDLRLDISAGVTQADALEELTRQSNLTWYLSGRSIQIVSKQQQIHNQLAKTLTKRYDNIDVPQVLLDLFQRAGVEFTVDPGAYQRIPAGYRTIRLQLDNATIQQALQTIGGYTGLAFDVTNDGVHVSTAALPATQ